MENSNVTIGNRTRDLPTYSAMPQPTAPPRARNIYIYIYMCVCVCVFVCVCWGVVNNRSLFLKQIGVGLATNYTCVTNRNVIDFFPG